MEEKKKIFPCKYEDEPADLKLMLIYFIKRMRFVVYFAVFGALLFAAVYYLKTFVFVDEHQYVARSELYLVYADDVRLENVYINDYTWQNLIRTDKAVDCALENIDDASVTEEFLKEAVWAGLVSDARFVELKVTTNDPELSIQIAQAYQIAIKKLGEEMVDIDTVTVFTEADSAEEITVNNRTFRMACTGAVIGALLAFFGIIFQYVFDDSVYTVNQFERRFGVPVIGICLKSKKNELLGESLVGQKSSVAKTRLWGRQAIKLNYKVLTSGYKKIVVTDTAIHGKSDFAFELLRDAKMKLEQDELLAIAMGNLKDEDAFYTSPEYELLKRDSINEDADVVVDCADADGVIVMVQMGAHNGKLVERALDLLVKQQCNVLGALLYDGDAALLKMYYFEPLPFGSKAEKEEEEEESEETFKLDDIF
ncbi:MAG: hypothetical protein IJA29_02835 [Lachnospiraceae bacterium]|nr:hypothetical protein [Lachnospiraceae bacterium]